MAAKCFRADLQLLGSSMGLGFALLGGGLISKGLLLLSLGALFISKGFCLLLLGSSLSGQGVSFAGLCKKL